MPDPEERKAFMDETKALDGIVDKQAFMYGRVVEKKARWNLCFDDKEQQPDYKEKKGTVVAFSKCPGLAKVRAGLGDLCGAKAKGLKAELNYYYDINKVKLLRK
jgi:hypothetical protein